jgi:hypothetical protein
MSCSQLLSRALALLPLTLASCTLAPHYRVLHQEDSGGSPIPAATEVQVLPLRFSYEPYEHWTNFHASSWPEWLADFREHYWGKLQGVVEGKGLNLYQGGGLAESGIIVDCTIHWIDIDYPTRVLSSVTVLDAASGEELYYARVESSSQIKGDFTRGQPMFNPQMRIKIANYHHVQAIANLLNTGSIAAPQEPLSAPDLLVRTYAASTEANDWHRQGMQASGLEAYPTAIACMERAQDLHAQRAELYAGMSEGEAFGWRLEALDAQALKLLRAAGFSSPQSNPGGSWKAVLSYLDRAVSVLESAPPPDRFVEPDILRALWLTHGRALRQRVSTRRQLGTTARSAPDRRDLEVALDLYQKAGHREETVRELQQELATFDGASS